MIPKFVIPFIYVFVLVSTNDQVVERNALKRIASGNIAPILKPEVATNEKVKIQLYYESLCPYCKIFGSTSFMNTVIELRAYLDVNIYPYGNARVTENGTVSCQHGSEECYGNKLHACAIDYLDDIILSVIYNGCMMDNFEDSSGSDDAAADECGKRMGIESGPIKQCAKGPKGDELLKFYGDESRKVTYPGVPTVLINGVPGDTDHFRIDVCDHFETPPKPCRR